MAISVSEFKLVACGQTIAIGFCNSKCEIYARGLDVRNLRLRTTGHNPFSCTQEHRMAIHKRPSRALREANIFIGSPWKPKKGVTAAQKPVCNRVEDLS